MSSVPTSFVFFGSATASIYVLDELKKAGMLPVLIVTTPDKPVGRGLTLTPTPVKIWAHEHDVPVFDPAKLDAEFVKKLGKKMEEIAQEKNAAIAPVFIVAAYGKIIPQAVLDLPKRGALNVHPTLLPLYRGSSPLHSTILDDAKKTGVTIMHIDALMDHGPIVVQKEITIKEWPTYDVFEEMMLREGGKILAEILPDWVAGTISEKEQDHAAATLTRKVSKQDGLVDFKDLSSDSPKTQYDIFRKIQAFHEWPSVYFFTNEKARIKITQAAWRNNTLVIEKVIPEGKKETDYATFLKNSGVKI